MALSRVPGYSLLANLDRQGTDLSLTSSGLTLFYWDVTNYRVGINTSTPLEPLHVEGNIFVANGNVYTSGNLTYDLGTPTNQWRNLYAGNVEAVNVNLSGTISIGGNITITGNTNGGVIYADELYDSNNRVLTTNTNFTLSGDVTGTGAYNGISLTIANTSVVAGTYGDYNQVPQIVVNSKGQVTGVTNVAIVLTQIGNITVNDTTISTASNITLAPANGYIFANNSIVSNVANPVSNTDAVTLQYLNSALSNVAGSLTSYDSSIVVNDNNVDPSYIITTVDGVVASNVFVNSVDYYVGVNIGAINIAGNTISSSGNLLLNAQGTGIVQFVGDDAVLLPVGNDTARPTNPTQGYFRYNSERDNIEFYNGTDWIVPGAAVITSDIINPDGVGNIFSLSSNATTSGVLVSINGTLQQPITAYTIVNNNQIQFTEVPLTSDTVEVRHITVSASTISKLAYGTNQIELDATAINVTGNVIPSANVTYSLGSADYQWKDLWVSSNTIYIGGTAVSVVDGQLSLNGNLVMPVPFSNVNVKAYADTMAYSNYSNVNVKAYADTMAYSNYSNVNTASYLGGSFSVGTITSGTWQGTAVGISYGGTGATTTSGVGGALDNLLPSGEQTGYVLSTSGAGTYSWVAPTAGSTTVGQSLTTLRQANTIVSNTSVINLSGISYTPGAGQLRVYVNGVRQFPSAYTETSNVSYTLSANVVAGDTVFTEIDAFSSFNNYANLTYASNVGNIAASGLTVQAAIEGLETNKAPLASPVFTGTPSINGVSIGYKELPQLTTSNVTLALTDSGKHFYTNTASTWYQVPSNANVAFPVGTTIVIVNKSSGNLTANTQAEVTMYLAGNTTASNRTITSYGMATLIKTATNEWFINGTGVV